MAKKTTLRLKEPKSASANKGKNSDKTPNWLEADSALTEQCRAGVTFSGFDKPYNSRKETFLISNSTGRHLAGVKVKIEYSDLQGRMIDAREETIVRAIPPDETRMATIKAADPQSTLYYHQSKAPRQGGQPFTVKITLLTLLLPK